MSFIYSGLLTALLHLHAFPKSQVTGHRAQSTVVCYRLQHFEDNHDGSTHNDEVSFVMLHECTINPIIRWLQPWMDGSHFPITSCLGNGPNRCVAPMETNNG